MAATVPVGQCRAEGRNDGLDQGKVIVTEAGSEKRSIGVAFTWLPEVASRVSRRDAVWSATKASVAGSAAYAARTGASVGIANANRPFRASTGAQPTSTERPPLIACSARTVAVGGLSVPDTLRSIEGGG